MEAPVPLDQWALALVEPLELEQVEQGEQAKAQAKSDQSRHGEVLTDADRADGLPVRLR
ncbi:hypothetical protein [Glycocaulis sp.]